MKIYLTENTLKLDDKIIVDAKKNFSDTHSQGWVDSHAFKELGEIWYQLRKAFESGKNIEETLKEVISSKFKIALESIESAEVEGGVPEHWKQTGEKKKFR